MLLHRARRAARFDEGDLVLPAERQSRLFDADLLHRGRESLRRAVALGGRGPYVLQAMIASLHAQEPRDWKQIASLYEELERITGSPVVSLARAVAVGEADGAAAGLRIAETVRLDSYHYLHATRAELLRRLGRDRDARQAYERALAQVADSAERRLLERRLSELDDSSAQLPKRG